MRFAWAGFEFWMGLRRNEIFAGRIFDVFDESALV